MYTDNDVVNGCQHHPLSSVIRRVGAGVVYGWVGTLASPFVLHTTSPFAVCILPSCACQFAFLTLVSLIKSAVTAETSKTEFAFIPHHQYHTGVEDRRVGTANDTYQQSQREWTNGCAAEQSKCAQGKDDGQRRIKRTGHGLHQAGIHYLVECLGGATLHVFTYAVEHHNCIVH